MSLPIIAIRPEPGCSATVAAGRAVGLEIEGWPLFEIRPVSWDAPARDSFDALLLGSANALRHGGPAITSWRGKPAYAVGEATAQAARNAGLDVVAVGTRTLQGLLETEEKLPPRLLRLAGVEHVPLTAPAGSVIETRILYESIALPMPEALAKRLSAGALVLLHSGAAALGFAGQCDRLCVPRGQVALAALAPRIAAAAGSGWRTRQVAAYPRDAELLALAADMCHDLRPAIN